MEGQLLGEELIEGDSEGVEDGCPEGIIEG